MGKVLRKIVHDRAQGIVVVPDWDTKPWFIMLKNIQVSEPMIIPVTNNTLFLHSSLQQKPHPLAGSLRLRVCKVSGES